MSKRFSTLIWLGAGTASEPENLLNSADYVVLVDYRESACALLKSKYSQQNVNVIQKLLNTESAPVEFTEYNLIEYSATKAATGLKLLFPGLKATKHESTDSTSISEFIDGIKIQNQNNLLVIDILDSNLILLTSMRMSNQLHFFHEVHVQAGTAAPYENAATSEEITEFMSKNGYLLQQRNSYDPDLPWLVFTVNPLWQELQKAQNVNEALNHELKTNKQLLVSTQSRIDVDCNEAKQKIDALKQKLNDKDSENESLRQQIKSINASSASEHQALNMRVKEKEKALRELNIELSNIQNQKKLAEENNESEKIKLQAEQLKLEAESKIQQLLKETQEQQETITKSQADIDLINGQLSKKIEKINDLERSNRSLNETNKHLTRQHTELTQELLKIEIQIDIIRELLLKQ